MNANDKKLTKLLERWQSGDFTRADEQELQRLLAEGDDFSRAAAEGYLSTPEEDHSQRLAVIRKKLIPSSNGYSFGSARLMALAASFALLLAAVWWTMRTDNVQQQTVQTTAAPSMVTPSDKADAPIAMSAEKEPAVRPTLPETSSEKGKGRPAPAKSTDYSVADVLSSSESVLGSAPEPLADDFPKAADSVAGEALSEVFITRSSPNTIPVEEKQASYPPTILRNGSEADTAQKEEAYDQKSMRTDKSKEKVTADSKKAAAQPSARAKEVVSVARPSPAGGWDKFRSAMLRQLTLPQAAKDQGVSIGKVTMIIDINAADGKIRSVFFINRLGFGCDELAEQFVQKYNWVVLPGGSNEVEVEVTFR